MIWNLQDDTNSASAIPALQGILCGTEYSTFALKPYFLGKFFCLYPKW